MAKTIGERIRELRKEQGLTQKELGERAGIAEPTIRRYELGRLNPKFETVKKIAKALGVPASCVYGLKIQEDADKQDNIEKMLADAVSSSGDVNIEKFTDEIVNVRAKKYAEELIQLRKATEELYSHSMKSWTDNGILNAINGALKTLNRIGKIEALKRIDELTQIPAYQNTSPDENNALPGGTEADHE